LKKFKRKHLEHGLANCCCQGYVKVHGQNISKALNSPKHPSPIVQASACCIKSTLLEINIGKIYFGIYLNWFRPKLFQTKQYIHFLPRHTHKQRTIFNPNSLWWVHMGISLKERQITEEPMKVKIWKKLLIHKHLV
jgi:hypothetical protein